MSAPESNGTLAVVQAVLIESLGLEGDPKPEADIADDLDGCKTVADLVALVDREVANAATLPATMARGV